MFSIMALIIGSEGDKISKNHCLSYRLSNYFLEILSPSLPIMGHNWKHNLARSYFILEKTQGKPKIHNSILNSAFNWSSWQIDWLHWLKKKNKCMQLQHCQQFSLDRIFCLLLGNMLGITPSPFLEDWFSSLHSITILKPFPPSAMLSHCSSLSPKCTFGQGHIGREQG